MRNTLHLQRDTLTRWTYCKTIWPGLARRAVSSPGPWLGRQGFTHSILRPAWFMQNFSETFLKPVNGAIVVPTGDGAEAFIDAEDIAAVAAATLAAPCAHAGAHYALTGPEALKIADAATISSQVRPDHRAR